MTMKMETTKGQNGRTPALCSPTNLDERRSLGAHLQRISYQSRLLMESLKKASKTVLREKAKLSPIK
jgi:hypothetical protein